MKYRVYKTPNSKDYPKGRYYLKYRVLFWWRYARSLRGRGRYQPIIYFDSVEDVEKYFMPRVTKPDTLVKEIST